MTNEELIRLAHSGDKEAEEELFSRNEDLIHHIAKKYNTSGIPYDELFSMAQFGMFKAYRSFDCDKGIKFASYAFRCMENEILHGFRKLKKIRREVSLESPLHYDKEGIELTLGDVLEDTNDKIGDYITNIALKDIIKEFIGTLSSKDMEIFEMFFIQGIKQREIGDYLNISQSHVSKLVKKLKSRLRTKAIKLGFTDSEEECDMMSSRKINVSELAYVLDNYSLTNEQLASLFNVSVATVYNYKKKLREGELNHNSVVDTTAIDNRIEGLGYVSKKKEEPIDVTVDDVSHMKNTFMPELPTLDEKDNVFKEIPNNFNAGDETTMSVSFDLSKASKGNVEQILDVIKGLLQEGREYDLYIY